MPGSERDQRRGVRSRGQEKIREALTPPASHRLRPASPVPTARQPFSGVTPEVHLTSLRRPRVQAFESATLAGGLAPPEFFVPYAAHPRNPETSFAQTMDNVDISGGAAAVGEVASHGQPQFDGQRRRRRGKIREALTAPACHRLWLTPPVPTACQLFSGVTPEVRLTSFRRPRARAFESATLPEGLRLRNNLYHTPRGRAIRKLRSREIRIMWTTTCG